MVPTDMVSSFIHSPRIVLADAINFPIVIQTGLLMLVPVTVFVVLIEAFIISRLLRYSFKKTVRFSFVANVLSTLAGIPTMFFNEWLFSVAKPHNLSDYFASYLKFSILATAVYFVVSVLVEFQWGLRWRRRQSIDATKSQLFVSIMTANLVSYAVLAPLHYHQSKPSHNILEFTTDSRWASRPATTVIYVDSSSNYLTRIESDGSHKEILIPFPVRDFLASSDLKYFVYRGIDGSLYYYESGSSSPVRVWDTKDRFLMNQVAISPSGGTVAFLASVKESEPYRLVLYDVARKAAKQTDYVTDASDYDPEIAWATNNADLFFQGQRKLRRLRLTEEGSIKITEVAGTNDIVLSSEDVPMNQVVLNPTYGRVGGNKWFGGDDWGTTFFYDKCNDLTAVAEPGLGSHIEVDKGGKRLIWLSDNPGLLHIARRGFSEMTFIHNCKECIFEDGRSIYLLDLQNKRVGKIADGSRHILLTDAYQKRMGLLDQELPIH